MGKKVINLNIDKNRVPAVPSRKWKNTKKEEKRQKAKEKIKSAYEKEVQVEVIPAKRDLDADTPKILRVAAYCRVSTGQETQAGSYELQVQYYTQYIQKHDDWELVEVYADEGISGTNIHHRTQFKRMIADCEEGKIDLIITKAISRFARNTLDCLSIVKQLKQHDPPIAVYFENEGINTTDRNMDAVLALLSTVAQGESEAKSEAIKWACRNRFANGIPLFPTWCILGYDKDEFGNVFIVEEEAEVVRYIFKSYLSGISGPEIAKQLTAIGIPTVKGLTVWSAGAVYGILKNEKYYGEVLMQKTVTPDCLTHRSVKNKGHERQYRITDYHPAIVSREDWDEVQIRLKNKVYLKRGKQKAPPPPLNLQWNKRGKLKGFMVLDPNWKRKDIERVHEGMEKHRRKKG